MTDALPFLPPTAAEVTPATVVAATPRGALVRAPAFGEQHARLAVVGAYAPRAGDQVLVLGDGRDQRYVVGVLRALRETEPVLEGVAIERDEAAGTTRLVVGQGDLELSAPSGRVRLSGAGGVVVESAAEVALRSTQAVSLECAGADGRTRSGLRLEGDVGELRAGVLATRAAHLRVLAEDVTVAAARLDTHIERLRRRVGRLETDAEEIVERAKTSYREVEGLAQTRAGRLRLVARGALTALAERAKLKAERVFAIDGESIHLG